jgi:hypothetical protein
MHFNYAFHSNLHVTSSNADLNKNDNLSWIYCPKFHLMFTVRNFFQTAILLSTCCEVSSR